MTPPATSEPSFSEQSDHDYYSAGSASLRHDEMRRWALAQGSPLDAAAGFLTADLCDMAAALAKPIKAALHDTLHASGLANEVTESLRLYLQVSRQAERCMKLAPRSGSSSSRANNSRLDTYVADDCDENRPPLEESYPRSQ